ncbi:exported hypothetical protein [Candidatus Accumulibacter aalborgensis]|uniref:Uncharacterized protein n=1 Tax=Candidatus Accumulibacter aalborgensis TaxID=1860102 RepID=A0A1A8XR48_9PROT|nr:exported hypothetical protein [Candidatus Accumulibacter aalborgensis]
MRLMLLLPGGTGSASTHRQANQRLVPSPLPPSSLRALLVCVCSRSHLAARAFLVSSLSVVYFWRSLTEAANGYGLGHCVSEELCRLPLMVRVVCCIPISVRPDTNIKFCSTVNWM